MHAYPASVSAESSAAYPPERILIVGLNWLGDSLMAMPAIQAYHRAFPEKRLTMLAKPKVAELWSMHPAIDETWSHAGDFPELGKIAAKIRERQFSAAFILPQSFRSALIPFLSGIPRRIGLPGHCRSWFLTKVVPPPQNAGSVHQKYEYMAIFGEEADKNELPVLRLSDVHTARTNEILGTDRQCWIGLMPGAARGPAKIWPPEYFSTLGQIIRKNHYGNIIIFGSAAEKDLCSRICARIGDSAINRAPGVINHAGSVINHARGVINLAGQTSLPELAAFLSRCSVVIGNDSGGIHLAAAVGAAVVAIFGITAPDKTRPLGQKVIVLQDSPIASRDIPRHSAAAEKSLKNISPELVAEKVRDLIEHS